METSTDPRPTCPTCRRRVPKLRPVTREFYAGAPLRLIAVGTGICTRCAETAFPGHT